MDNHCYRVLVPTAGTLAPPTSIQNFIINKHKINQRETILLIFIDCLDWLVSDDGAPDQDPGEVDQ